MFTRHKKAQNTTCKLSVGLSSSRRAAKGEIIASKTAPRRGRGGTSNGNKVCRSERGPSSFHRNPPREKRKRDSTTQKRVKRIIVALSLVIKSHFFVLFSGNLAEKPQRAMAAGRKFLSAALRHVMLRGGPAGRQGGKVISSGVG